MQQVPRKQTIRKRIHASKEDYIMQNSKGTIGHDDVGLHVLGCRFDILGTNCRTIGHLPHTQFITSALYSYTMESLTRAYSSVMFHESS